MEFKTKPSQKKNPKPNNPAWNPAQTEVDFALHFPKLGFHPEDFSAYSHL